MRRTLAAFAILSAIGMGAAPARAANQDFTLFNQTGYQIDKVYVSSSGTSSWEEDIMGSGTLGNGESVAISFEKGSRGCSYDLKVVYNDGESAVWNGLDLCSISNVHIHWNKASGATTATAD